MVNGGEACAGRAEGDAYASPLSSAISIRSVTARRSPVSEAAEGAGRSRAGRARSPGRRLALSALGMSAVISSSAESVPQRMRNAALVMKRRGSAIWSRDGLNTYIAGRWECTVRGIPMARALLRLF